MLATVIAICVLAFPLASVAETYEYDVLRILNNMGALSGARRHIGDQIIPHIQALDWGFRFAGAVINTKACMGLLLGMLSTMIGTVGQLVMDRSSSSNGS